MSLNEPLTEAIIQAAGLTPKQLEALPLLAAGQTPTQVADTIGINPGTIHNWHSLDPKFKAELYGLRMDLYLQGTERLKALVLGAAEALGDVLEDPNASPRDRIQAARTVLQFTCGTKHAVQLSSDERAASSIAAILEQWRNVETSTAP